MRLRVLAVIRLATLIGVLLAAVLIMLSHQTFSMVSVGTLKCYNGENQRPC